MANSGPSRALAAPATLPPELEPGWTYRPPLGDHPPRLDGLPETLQAIVDASSAHWGIGVRDLSTGETVSLNATEQFPSASLYKLGVLLEVEQRLEDGDWSHDQPVLIDGYDTDPAFGGSAFYPGNVLSVDDALDWMVTRSDNGASLALVRDLGGSATINARFQALGMWQSVFGGDAYTSPADQLRLFTELANGQAGSPEVSAEALALLAQQQVNDRIPQGLPPEDSWIVAHKTGDTDDVLADSGIVATPTSAYVITLFADHMQVYADARSDFATFSAAVYNAFLISTPAPTGGALYYHLATPLPTPPTSPLANLN